MAMKKIYEHIEIMPIALTLTLIIHIFLTTQNIITILYRKLGEKDKFFTLHFHMYVRTGMRAASMFCTRFKNKKNSGGTLLTLTHLQQTNRLFSLSKKANVHNNRSFCGRGSYTQVFLILRIIWYFCWLRGKKGMLC